MAFVDEILRLPDVYFVTSQEVIDFTKYPQTLKAIANNEKFGCRRYGQQLFFLRRFFRKANLSSSEGLFDELRKPLFDLTFNAATVKTSEFEASKPEAVVTLGNFLANIEILDW